MFWPLLTFDIYLICQESCSGQYWHLIFTSSVRNYVLTNVDLWYLPHLSGIVFWPILTFGIYLICQESCSGQYWPLIFTSSGSNYGLNTRTFHSHFYISNRLLTCSTAKTFNARTMIQQVLVNKKVSVNLNWHLNTEVNNTSSSFSISLGDIVGTI